jgi:HEPN domain-containing protein
VNDVDLVQYRIRLARGFLEEAEQDFTLRRWRSCVDNSQLVVENAGKAVLAVFGITPKTHDPAQQVGKILRERKLTAAMRERMQDLLPDLLALGATEHFLTDYGDEAAQKLPWDLFDSTSASSALQSARRSIECASKIVETHFLSQSDPE